MSPIHLLLNEIPANRTRKRFDRRLTAVDAGLGVGIGHFQVGLGPGSELGRVALRDFFWGTNFDSVSFATL